MPFPSISRSSASFKVRQAVGGAGGGVGAFSNYFIRLTNTNLRLYEDGSNTASNLLADSGSLLSLNIFGSATNFNGTPTRFLACDEQCLSVGGGTGLTLARVQVLDSSTQTLMTGFPTSPTSVLAIPDSDALNIELEWTNAGSNTTSFVIYRAVNAGPFLYLSEVTGTFALNGRYSFVDTTANPNLFTYTYYIHAKNSFGYSYYTTATNVVDAAARYIRACEAAENADMSVTEKYACNDFIQFLQVQGIWDFTDRAWLVSSMGPNAALICCKSLQVMTNVDCTYSASTGFSQTGASYLSSNFDLSNASFYGPTAALLGGYMSVFNSVKGVLFGVNLSGTGSDFSTAAIAAGISNDSGDQQYGLTTSATNSGVSRLGSGTEKRFWAHRTKTATNHQLYNQGIAVGTMNTNDSTGDTVPFDDAVFILAVNNGGGSPEAYFDGAWMGGFIGGELDDVQNTQLSDAFDNYNSTMGRLP